MAEIGHQSISGLQSEEKNGGDQAQVSSQTENGQSVGVGRRVEPKIDIGDGRVRSYLWLTTSGSLYMAGQNWAINTTVPRTKDGQAVA